jgi:hypothetical protein
MARSLRERLRLFGTGPSIIKRALTLDDVQRYHLPPDFTKATDTRRVAFVAKYGDIAVELDALPDDVLQARLVEGVKTRMGLDAFHEVQEAEAADRERLRTALENLS